MSISNSAPSGGTRWDALDKKFARSTFTSNPFRATCIAGSKSRFQGSLPCRLCSSSHPRISPGTPTARPPTVEAVGSAEWMYMVSFPAAGMVSRKSICACELWGETSTLEGPHHLVVVPAVVRVVADAGEMGQCGMRGAGRTASNAS